MTVKNFFCKMTAFFCAVMLLTILNIPAFAIDYTVYEPSPGVWNEIDPSKVETIVLVEQDYYASYTIPRQNDRAAIIQALNRLEVTGLQSPMEGEVEGVRLLQIRMKNGAKFEYWCYQNLLLLDGSDVPLVSGSENLKPLYNVMDYCIKNYPANAAWLGYMNPYRITTVGTFSWIGSEIRSKVFKSDLSAENRDQILKIARQLKALKVSSVRELDREIGYNGIYGSLWKIRLDFETIEEGYDIQLYDNATMAIDVDSLDIHLYYTINTTDNTAWKTLIDTLDKR